MSYVNGWAVLPVLVCAGFCVAQTEPGAEPRTVEVEAVPERDDEVVGERMELVGGDRAEGYEGHRGLVSISRLTGMFYNPTAGTLYEGQLTAQYCMLYNEASPNNNTSHGILVAYGVTDWLEVGAFGGWLDDRANDMTRFAAGPLARVRLTKDDWDGWMPETSLGVVYLDGASQRHDALSKFELAAMVSKGFILDEDGFFRSVRVHGGYRYIMFPEQASAADDVFSTLYIGGELELPYRIFAIGEVNTKDLSSHGDQHTPYAFGLQWKPNNVVGITTAGVQRENDTQLAFWFGVGLTFNF